MYRNLGAIFRYRKGIVLWKMPMLILCQEGLRTFENMMGSHTSILKQTVVSFRGHDASTFV
jgi:hypothetical protein